MKKIKWLFIIGLLVNSLVSLGQSPVDSIKFFTDDKLIDMTLTTDIRKLQTEKKLEVYQPASVTCRFPDSSIVNEDIRIYARGHFRRENCTIPPLMLNFHNPTSPLLNQLGKLKLVIGCGTGSEDEQLILKEYLAYKTYNLLTDKSFRVRLVRVNYRDSRNKMKPFSQYAFFIEDDDDMAARNGCVKKDDIKVTSSERTDRATMTMVAVYEYFMSNTDWSILNHNLKVMYDKNNEKVLPFAVAYDFDHSGLVNASYAVANEEITGTASVTERVYRGFPRAMEELEPVFALFRKQRENINSLIMNFTLLKEKTRKETVGYLDDFYKVINNKNEAKSIFIDNARGH